ncbi:helix-turn-helix domain-containing protein [Agaribacterium sp. ZY112]|uniref:helix-turn-helix domain-containing protein n=1 Tax=Agaribacterium sp. ZY112 TaxID=3233574 RepID=UPI0035256EB2
MEEQILEDFGAHLRSLRLAAGLSQEQLALKAGLDRTYVSGVERGLRNLSLLNLVKIAQALELTLPELVDFSENSRHG